MKAKDALEMLGISRKTLSRHVQSGKIKVVKLLNGRYDYDKDSIESLIKKNNKVKTVIYVNPTNTLDLLSKERKVLKDYPDYYTVCNTEKLIELILQGRLEKIVCMSGDIDYAMEILCKRFNIQIKYIEREKELLLNLKLKLQMNDTVLNDVELMNSLVYKYPINGVGIVHIKEVLHILEKLTYASESGVPRNITLYSHVDNNLIKYVLSGYVNAIELQRKDIIDDEKLKLALLLMNTTIKRG